MIGRERGFQRESRGTGIQDFKGHNGINGGREMPKAQDSKEKEKAWGRQ